MSPKREYRIAKYTRRVAIASYFLNHRQHRNPTDSLVVGGALEVGAVRYERSPDRRRGLPCSTISILSKDEITSLLQDLGALKAGRITGVVGSEIWYRMLAEIARFQHKREIESPRSLVHAMCRFSC